MTIFSLKCDLTYFSELKKQWNILNSFFILLKKLRISNFEMCSWDVICVPFLEIVTCNCGQIKSFNNDIFATRGTRCLDFILVCFHQPPSAPSIFCFLTDLAWLTIYRGRCRGSVKTQVGLSALWRRNFAHNDCSWYKSRNNISGALIFGSSI